MLAICDYSFWSQPSWTWYWSGSNHQQWKLTVGRELKMIELKREIAELKKEIPADKLEK